MSSMAVDASGKRKREAGKAGSSTSTTSKPHKDRADARTTLGSLLKYMEGYEVIVELKTGNRHRGHLLSADDNMNLILEEEEEGESSSNDAREPQSGQQSIRSGKGTVGLLPGLVRNIRGSKIRYIHFPDNANIPVLIRSGRERERNASKKYQKTKRVRK